MELRLIRLAARRDRHPGRQRLALGGEVREQAHELVEDFLRQLAAA
jgi:hypothetical protein